MPKTVDEIIERFNEMASERTTWDSHCQEVADYMNPLKGVFTATRTPGSKIRTKIYEETAIYARDILTAGIHGQLTSPSMPWFKIQPQDPDLKKNEEVKLWFSEVQRRMYQVFNQSNFNTQIHEGYLDIVSFGMMDFYSEPDPKQVVRFDARPTSECYVAENEAKKIDTVFRKTEFTARQALQKWGMNALPENIQKSLKQKKYNEKFAVIHAVFPREDYDPLKIDNKNAPWASVYIEVEKKHLLAEKGYQEFPYACPRWSKGSGEVYGRSPAMKALSTIKVINAMEKTILRAGQKAVDPPLMVPYDGFIAPLNTSPGALLMKRGSIGANEKIEPLLSAINLPLGFELLDRKQIAILKAFYVDLFLMLSALKKERSQVTATEILERVEEKMVVLGPTLGRLMSELLSPVIQRTFSIMARTRRLPPIPAVLKGQEYDIEYISPLARAQRMPEVTAINRSLNFAMIFAEAKPEIMDKYNLDKTVDYVNEILGVPPEIMSSDDELEAIRAERQQAEQAKAAILMAQQGGEAAESLSRGMKGMEGIAIPSEAAA